MKVGYFTYNGKTYESGTEFLINLTSLLDGSTHQRTCVFLHYNTDTKKYMYRFEQTGNYYNHYKTTYCNGYLTDDEFRNQFAGVTGYVDTTVKPPVLKQRSDAQIDGMIEGWIVYIAAMVVSIIFEDNIGLWALWSCIFFSWRADKIKKEGTYYERQT